METKSGVAITMVTAYEGCKSIQLCPVDGTRKWMTVSKPPFCDGDPNWTYYYRCPCGGEHRIKVPLLLEPQEVIQDPRGTVGDKSTQLCTKDNKRKEMTLNRRPYMSIDNQSRKFVYDCPCGDQHRVSVPIEEYLKGDLAAQKRKEESSDEGNSF